MFSTLLKFSLVTATAILFGACNLSPKNDASNAQSAAEAPVTLPEDFKSFYAAFHQDSLYQIKHISWPLQGEKTTQEGSGPLIVQSIYWQPEQWLMHRTFDPSEFKQDWTVVTDGILIERILPKLNVGFGIERRFARQNDGEWQLIFYSGLREMGQ